MNRGEIAEIVPSIRRLVVQKPPGEIPAIRIRKAFPVKKSEKSGIVEFYH